MVWQVTFHREVQNDFRELGRVEATRIMAVINGRIANGEPDKSGKPLHGAQATRG
jgi:mRNA interferase RelE/StbE